MRTLLVITAAAAAGPALADRIATPTSPPVVRVAEADLTVAGKVTAVEADPVEVDKVPYRVALVKVEQVVAGETKLTHVKVGWPVGRSYPQPLSVPLADGQEGCFFLTKHAGGNFFTIRVQDLPLNAGAGNYKEQFEAVKQAAAVLADPLTALKADKPEQRHFAAVVLASKYRPAAALRGAEQVAIPAEESKLIVKGLLDADWTKPNPTLLPPTQAALRLGMTAADGWKPQFKGQGDFNQFMQEAFRTWAAGPGAAFVIKKIVPKSK